MKIRFSRITLWFTLAGFSLGLMNLVLSAVGWIFTNPAVGDVLSRLYFWFVWVCPFAAGDMELEHLHRWSDIAWVFLEVIVLNTLLYFILGLIFSTWIRLLKRWQESPIVDKDAHP